jgi:alpha-N-acetylglucosamine transferase
MPLKLWRIFLKLLMEFFLVISDLLVNFSYSMIFYSKYSNVSLILHPYLSYKGSQSSQRYSFSNL